MKTVALVLTMALLAVPALGVTLGQPETWDGPGTAGWVAYDLINQTNTPAISVENQALKLLFSRQQVAMPPEEYLVKADAGASTGAFVGNYISNGVMAISFRLYCSMAPGVWVRFYNGDTGRLWRYGISGIQAGEWQDIIVPVDLNALKNIDGAEGWQEFRHDLMNVGWMGVSFKRNSSTNEQVCRIDDFAILGAGPEYAAWVEQYGDVGDGNTLPGNDLDGDGADNYGEWVAGTSAGDNAEVFTLTVGKEIGPVSGGPAVVLKWRSESGRKYGVLRSSDLGGSFTEIASEIDATPPENVYEDTSATGSAVYYYRLSVEN